ncbi:MAG TPA: ester cyclase [Acidimicrobiia bacterium]|nr:ester cyclase [Acidimicrobiia bacterium]
MSQENKDVVRKFFQILEDDVRIPEELLGPGFVYNVPGVPPMDVDAIQDRAAAFVTAFSDSTRIEDDLIAEGDRVAFRSTLEMTHTGEFMGAAGTGERISVVEMGFFRIVNGKISEMWGLLDTMGLLTQVGTMPNGV